MITITKKIADIRTLVACKTIQGTSFVGVRNYENSKGEVSNQTFLVGINYGKLLENDLKTLQAFDVLPLVAKHGKEVVMKAYQEMLASLTKRTASEFVEGNYPTVNSRLKTIVKAEITKSANLRGGKFKQFKLGAFETLNIQGLNL